MGFQKTREYYDSVSDVDLCHCAYCRNYIQQIKRAYPSVDQYFEAIGVDIEKPFETMPLEPDDNGQICYLAAQYIVMGSSNDFETQSIDGVEVNISLSHPSTDGIEGDHFVIEISPICLDWKVKTIIITRKRSLASAIVPFWIIASKESKKQFMDNHNWQGELCEHNKNGQPMSRIDIAELDNLGVRIASGQTIAIGIPNDTVSVFACTKDGSLSNEIMPNEITESRLTIITKGGFRTVSYPSIEIK